MAADRHSLADAALDQLVRQFTRPLHFVRELVQNALDAGTPRIDIRVRFEADSPSDGVVCVSVRDGGEGMDEAAIDEHLTRLYASSKAGDLRALGRFGVGFASVFAFEPDAVLVRTGRDGEGWELLFRSDRSFEKVRLEEPVDGTLVEVYKRMPADRVDAFVEACRASLAFWCEHCRVPIAIHDRGGAAPPLPVGADPFAPFETVGAPLGPTGFQRPLALDDAALAVAWHGDGVEVVVGYAETPERGFYRGGLLLATGDEADALGRYADLLAHVAFKVDHHRLEHTLAREHVVRDAAWDEAMHAVLRAREVLQRELVEQLERCVATGGDPRPLHRFLALECRAPDGLRLRARLARRPVFVDVLGRPLTLEALEEQEQRLGVVVVGAGPDALCRALTDRGVRVLLDGPSTRDLLQACEEALHLAPLRQPRRIVAAAERWVLVDPIPEEDLPIEERDLLGRTAERLRAAAPPGTLLGPAPLLVLGDFGGIEVGVRAPLVLTAPRTGRVARREDRAAHVLGFRLRPLAVNRHHPLFRSQLLAAREDPGLASLALAQALLDRDPVAPDRAWRRLLRAALEEGGPPS